MSAPETPSDSDPRAQAAPEQNQRAGSASQASGVSPSTQPPTSDAPAPRKRPWGWIAIAGLLAACVVGLGIYAINLNSDVDDANAQIAAQQEQIDQAEESSAASVAAAQAAYDELTAQLGAAEQDASAAVEQAAEELNQAEQAAADAQGTAEELQAQADATEAKAENAATCAQSFLSAFSGVFSGATLQEGVEATLAELQALQPQCETALAEGGSGS